MVKQIRPPTLAEKLAYTKQNRLYIVGLGVLSFLPLIGGMLLFASADWKASIFFPIAIMTGLYLSVSYLIGIFGKAFNLKDHEYTQAWALKSKESSVDVFLPVCKEDTDVILNTWKYVRELEWDGSLNVYVLDDGHCDTLKEKAAEVGFHYLRRDGNEFKKAGNLKHAFFQTSGEFILILDADFCPRSDMLKELVPYMFRDPKISIVQTPQYFECSGWMNWVEQGAGYVQELFYRLIQVSRNAFGGSICVGSCALYRRKALEEIGGPVQIGHSEDVWTGYKTICKGWKVRFVALNYSKGRCPDNLKAFFNQQYRWCSGSMSLAGTKDFYRSPLTTMQKVCYASGFMYYAASGIATLVAFVPSALALGFFNDHIHWYNVIFYGPSFLYGTLVTVMWSHYRANLNYMRLRHLSYYAHLLSLRDRVLGTVQAWSATGAKQAGKGRFETAMTVGRISTWAQFVILASLSLFRIFENPDRVWDFFPNTVFAVIHFFIGLSVFFADEPLPSGSPELSLLGSTTADTVPPSQNPEAANTAA
jgi:cellulose synthase/poly-beta-1,6-N-acetylglucosamine synthase-like glycosyltransferase